MNEEIKRTHLYHAEATALYADLKLPLTQDVGPQAFVKLSEQGGYLAHHAERYRLSGVLSFSSAYTQVAGNRDVKPGHGWSTLATSVVEHLNVLDVVTADRVVAQVATEHPLVGYVPSVSFLGTRFENLKIAGHPVKLDLDLNILGEKPGNDAPYSKDSGFIQRVTSQYERLREHRELSADILERYNQPPSSSGNQESIECSLVNQAGGSYPGKSFGHVIDVPNFGKIYLATLRVEQSDSHTPTGVPRKTLINLTMIECHMGCLAAGRAGMGNTVTNGSSNP
ncbi:MAG: choice-of-anchor P family protein [Terracidiphilus sp.]|jgi:hypothetical protein